MRCVPVFWICFMLLSGAPARAAETLEIGYPEEVNAFHQAAAAILTEAYGTLGIQVHFKTYPSERSLRFANDGVTDGELVRIAGLEKAYPNLLEVPVSHVQAEQMAFASRDIHINGWPSLQPLRIVFHRGYKAAEKGTQGMQVQLTNSDLNAFELVERGRADVAIANRFTGEKLLHSLNYPDLRMLTPALEVTPLYHYLNRKHLQLLPKITAALNKMRTSGRFEAIYRQYGVMPLQAAHP